MDFERIDDWATWHHGVITRRAARTLGWSDGDWYRAVEVGHVELVHPGVARLRGSARTVVQRIHAAVLAGGGSAVASHRSAASLWGIERPDADPVDLIVDRCVTRLRLDGVVVHRPRDRADLSVSRRHLTPSTNLLRTLVDLGAVSGSVDDAVSAAVTSGAVTPAVLQGLLLRHARSGRNGVGALRRALESWPLQGKPADSDLELAMARLIERFGLPPATFHPPRIAGYEVDFCVDGSNVVLECDGWDHHGRTREQFERDVERDQRLALAGYVVFHFTWRQVTRRPGPTAQRLHDLLQRWAPHLLDPAA
jgi:hypothetical protein